MLSAFPSLQTIDGFLENHLPVCENDFISWDNFDPFFSLTNLEPGYVPNNPVLSPSGSETLNPSPEPVLFKPNRKRANNSSSWFDDFEPVLNDTSLVTCNPTLENVTNSNLVAIGPVSFNSDSDNFNPNQKPVLSKQTKKKTKHLSSSSDDAELDQEDIIEERKRRRMESNKESARRSRMRKLNHLENLRNQANRLQVGNQELVNRLRFATHHLQVVKTDNNRLQSEIVILRNKLLAAQQVLLVRELQNQIAPTTWAYNTNIMAPINQQILL